MAKMNDSTRLKVLLKEKHMKQREFAEWFCISWHAAWEVINGRRPLKDFEIVEICKRFNVSSDWLLGLSDVKEYYFSSAKNDLESVETIYKDEILDKVIKACEEHRSYQDYISGGLKSSGCGCSSVRAGKLR